MIKKILNFTFLMVIGFTAQSQVIKNSTVNLNLLNLDSVRLNSKSNMCLIMLNYQTGETTVKVKAETFTSNDSNLRKMFQQKSNDMEMHFVIPKNMLDQLTTDNKEHADETAGMLYMNNHFNNVRINYSFYNKSGNTIDFANNNVFFSFQFNFDPAYFQIEPLTTTTKDPVLIWSSKQPINFTNTD